MARTSNMWRTCEVCSTEYYRSYSKQRTCGRQCGLELRRREGTVGHPCPKRKRSGLQPRTLNTQIGTSVLTCGNTTC